jgi:hypothetical protein
MKHLVSFEAATKQFQGVVENMNIAIVKLQDKTSFQWKVFGVIGGILLVLLGAVIGQFVHFKPF